MKSMPLLFALLVTSAAPIVQADTERNAEQRRGQSAHRISAGGNHTCAIRGDGTVLCWGANESGQLGDGTTTARLTPVVNAMADRAQSITAGARHACATSQFGLQCWGSNARGQLGINSTVNSATSRAVTVSAMYVSAGGDSTCAVGYDGILRCWGDNAFGKLGDGTTTQRLVPTQVLDPEHGWVQVSVGTGHVCAVRATGRVACWGNNGNGQLGDGTTVTRGTPLDVPGITNAVTVSVSASSTCVLRGNGSTSCWGANSVGQAGIGSTTPAAVLTPTAVLGPDDSAQLDLGGAACITTATGTARCWGGNSAGQLGDGTLTNQSSPVDVFQLSGVVEVSAGSAHTCAIRANGSVACWGNNASGQLGNGTRTTISTPQSVQSLAGTINGIRVSAGGGTTCAVRDNGQAACWGQGTEGQVGNGLSIDQSLPRAVANSVEPVPPLRTVQVGALHACALTQNGTVVCWGDNSQGQLGTGANAGSNVPVPVSGISDAIGVATGGNHSCAVRVNGVVRCWGANESGQLGNGTSVGSSVPVTVGGTGRSIGVAAGGRHNCSLRIDGRVLCWGANDFGQLGNGSNTPSSDAVIIPGLTSIVALSAGQDHTCAIRADGTVSCWGRNLSGELGDGSGVSRVSPTPVAASDSSGYLSAGLRYTCLFRRCWGDNAAAQLANGTPSQQPALSPISANQMQNAARSMGSGSLHNCWAEFAGRIVCVGVNNRGQLGAGSVTSFERLAKVADSFTVNIDPKAALRAPGRTIEMGVFAQCEANAEAHIELRVVQGSTQGTGRAVGRCTGRMERYPVVVSAQGRDGFAAGGATATADAMIMQNGAVIDSPTWARQVNVASASL